MYIFTFFLIAVFIAWEVYQFLNTKQIISRYQNIFPDSTKDSVTLNKNLQIETSHNSEAFTNIVSTLNRYLDENSEQVSDYHLMKDVVDRNREISESEIESFKVLIVVFILGFSPFKICCTSVLPLVFTLQALICKA